MPSLLFDLYAAFGAQRHVIKINKHAYFTQGMAK